MGNEWKPEVPGVEFLVIRILILFRTCVVTRGYVGAMRVDGVVYGFKGFWLRIYDP